MSQHNDMNETKSLFYMYILVWIGIYCTNINMCINLYQMLSKFLCIFDML